MNSAYRRNEKRNKVKSVRACVRRKKLSAARDNDDGARATLACRLRDWRKEQGMSLKSMATDLGVSVSALSLWENAHRFPSAEMLDVLTDYTGERLCRLFCPEPDCPLSKSYTG